MIDSDHIQPATNHTPGAWELGGKTKHYRRIMSNSTSHPCIAEVRADDLDATGEANARLIAAAPELLEALQEAIDLIVYWHGDMLTEEERNHPRGSGPARVYDKATAAIAK